MISAELIKKIKIYAVASFLVPLIAVNSCLIIYGFLGYVGENIAKFPNINWNVEKIDLSSAISFRNPFNKARDEHIYLKDIELSPTTFYPKHSYGETFTYTNCPKYKFESDFITADNQTLEGTKENEVLINNLLKNKKIKTLIYKRQKDVNVKCVKNHPFLYSVLKKFNPLETILIRASLNNPSGFSQIKNPYFYGEVSISRTARYFPTILIFKTLIILSSFLLFLYWKNNLNLFSELKKNNILGKFSKNFFYMGLLSCTFLMLHATFLGLDFDSKLFSKIRRIIIILFIFFELAAQISLTRNLFKFQEELQEYIKPLILKIKIIFLIIVFSITCIAFVILAFGDPSTAFKHILEWNYFSLLLVYYLLSRLLWKTP